MTTFTEIAAAVVVHSSAVALSHFGVIMEPAQAKSADPAPIEHVVARSHSPQHRVIKLTSCPQARHRAHPLTV
jgi:hypothetical protein